MIAVITTPSGEKVKPQIINNNNGTIKVSYQPKDVGLHSLHVSYGNKEQEGSPYNFYVHAKKPGDVIAYGPGLCCGTVGQPSTFTVVTKDAGPGKSVSKTQKVVYLYTIHNMIHSCTKKHLYTLANLYTYTMKSKTYRNLF